MRLTTHHGLRLGLAMLVFAMLGGCLSGRLWYCRGESGSRLDTRQAMAIKILQRASTVESVYVDFAGAPSCYVKAYRRVHQSPRADGRFKTLLTTADTPAGELYALAGLYWTDPEGFRRVLPPYLGDDQTRVPQVEGCIYSEEMVATVAARIEDGYWPKQWAYDLPVEGALP